ncbi:tetratricopeptide repeat protein [Sphingomonas sp. GCM10030256]|uniref:tetratricopeptide repeat protein n=1 Tax=Sphingomonas sp. GCM10030256 TaxID=3273427 RepID=UPI003609D19C
MTFTRTALAAVLALGVAGIGIPASAQQQPAVKVKISAGASKAILALESAVRAKDYANVPARLAAAHAAAKTNDDRYAIASLQYQAAVGSNDNAGKLAGIDGMLNSGVTPANLVPQLRYNQAQIKYAAKDYAGASIAAEALLATDPNNIDANLLLAETRNAQGRTAEAVPLLQRVISAQKASGQKVREDILKRATGFAFQQKLPAAGAIALEWASQYPTASNWRDAIRVYEVSTGITDEDRVDTMRLARAAGALTTENDFQRYAAIMSNSGYPGEVKAVLDEGVAAGKIDRSKPMFRDLYASASGKVVADRALLLVSEKTATAGSSARPLTAAADRYLSYGDNAKAAALYRAALGKSGADTNLVNLRLGIALARSGDKAGAAAALNAVTGPRANVAKLWTTWLNSRG